MNILTFSSYISFRVPRVKYDNCGIHMIDIPWSRQKSTFTSNFEQELIDWCHTTPVVDVARKQHLYDQQIWNTLFFYKIFF
jgi:transposase